MKRDYITYSLQEYILLGRKDALTSGKRDTANIINELNSKNRLYVIKRLRNYLLGYRMGIVELSLKNIHENPIFDKEKCVLVTSKKQLPNREMEKIAKDTAIRLVLGR